MFEHPWSGVFAATLCPFEPDYGIDVEGLQAYTRYLASVPNLKDWSAMGTPARSWD